jgi:dethiobiotin synthetase
MTRAAQLGVFVTGTDTGVGKTVVAAALIRALARDGRRVAAMKPVSAGATATPAGLRNSDALALMQAANVAATYECVNPYCFAPPIAPHIAARDAGVTIDIELVRRRFDVLAGSADCIVVEGAGGWLTPISASLTMADLAAALALPVVLVVGLKLGCLNHAQLTARALAAHREGLAGWIGNSLERAFDREADNIAALESLLGASAAAIVPYASHGSELLALAPAAARRLLGVPR